MTMTVIVVVIVIVVVTSLQSITEWEISTFSSMSDCMRIKDGEALVQDTCCPLTRGSIATELRRYTAERVCEMLWTLL
jgi:membrane protein YdbS with pleckstrin-like domain